MVTAKKGHKLLKDKQDELMRIFIETIKENKEIRKKVEEKLINSFKNFTLSKALISEGVFEESLAVPKFSSLLLKKNVMSVRVPKIDLKKWLEMKMIFIRRLMLKVHLN